MRTRGLTGPFFGRHSGNRASHPLAHAASSFLSGLGPELVINGGFDTDTNWPKVGNWSIAAGVATASSVITPGSNIRQLIAAVVSGKTYRLSITTNGSYISGLDVTLDLGGFQQITSNGIHVLEVTAGSTPSIGLYIATVNDAVNDNFLGDIDDISLREIL